MPNLVETCLRVQNASRPHVKYDRLNGAGGDLTEEILLNDLVDARAFVPVALKTDFLRIWAGVPEIAGATPAHERDFITRQLVLEFAALAPVVDLGPNWA
ncbi:Uncharacterised protein [Corynebacterium amycolatum]|nr:Uncharacterised protein [Corynebacterium amycolatum]